MFKTFILFSIFIVSSLVIGLSGISASAGPEQSSQIVREKRALSTVQPNTVLELFTSQGCSSCPAANKFVREISNDPEVLVLSYSVDYWDYLGWKDTFGKPEFSARQRAYGQHFNGQVYTPQMVLNGVEHKARYSRKKVRMSKLSAQIFDVQFTQGKDENTVGLEVQMKGAKTSKKYTVMAVTYKPGTHQVPVKRGENRGRTINLANVVTNIERLATLDGQILKRQIPRPKKGEALAIFVQSGNAGDIVAAAQIGSSSE